MATTLLFSPLCLCGGETNTLGAKEMGSSYLFGSLLKNKLRDRLPRSILLPASDFVATEGSSLQEFSMSNANESSIVYAIDFPSYIEASAPSASTFLLIPPRNFKEILLSAIKFSFFVPANSEQGIGDVTFNVAASITAKDGGVTEVDLGDVTISNVGEAPSENTLPSPANYQYQVKIKTYGVFAKGDSITLIIKRVNSDAETEFGSSVYVPAVAFIYNVRPKR